MIVDSSAIIAIALKEPDWRSFGNAMNQASDAAMSAATIVECHVVASRRGGPELVAQVDLIVANAAIDIVPVSVRQAQIARDAFTSYGQGSRHPAKLNFGDCFTYALATERDEPILCKGDDFIHTDRAVVPAP